MYKTLLLVLVSTLTFATTSFAGQSGNGGDVITCQASSANSLSGIYVLDYVAAYDDQTVFLDEATHPLEQIWKNLSAKGQLEGNDSKILREMAISLFNFYTLAQDQIFKKTDYKNYFVWMPQPFGIIDLKDENLVQIVPDNCTTVVAGNRVVNVNQAVVREDHEYGSIFRYDPKVLKALQAKSSLQMSFLLVHEWLRRNLEDTRALRDITKLLHTKEFNEASAADMVLMIRQVSGRDQIVPNSKDFNSYHELTISEKAPTQSIVLQAIAGKPARITFNYQYNPRAYSIEPYLRKIGDTKETWIGYGRRDFLEIEAGQELVIKVRLNNSVGKPVKEGAYDFVLVQVKEMPFKFEL